MNKDVDFVVGLIQIFCWTPSHWSARMTTSGPSQPGQPVSHVSSFIILHKSEYNHFPPADVECPTPSTLNTDTIVAVDGTQESPLNYTETFRSSNDCLLLKSISINDI